MKIAPNHRIALFVCIVGVLSAWWLSTNGALDPAVLLQYKDGHPVWSLAVFVGVYALSVVALIPTLPLNLAAGVVWGPLSGGIVATIAMTLGSIASFAISRYLVPSVLGEWLQSRVRSFSHFQADWRLVAMLRLNPVLPAGPLNYMFGLTRIRFGTYLWATAVFLLPPAVAVAALGSSVTTFLSARERNVVRGIVWGFGALALLAAVRYVGRQFTEAGGNDRHPVGADAE